MGIGGLVMRKTIYQGVDVRHDVRLWRIKRMPISNAIDQGLAGWVFDEATAADRCARERRVTPACKTLYTAPTHDYRGLAYAHVNYIEDV